jgi:signal transduction histidine kinase
VTIHLQPTPGSLTFAVQDSGMGIPESDMKRLFEKFYRGTNREALAQRGTGLGLAIVKSIAERHSGKVWVESELGKGSIFYLQVPLVQPKEIITRLINRLIILTPSSRGSSYAMT